jgi:Tfp pilus assembly protein FimV
MSLATTFPPDVDIPAPAHEPVERLATVLPFRSRRATMAPEPDIGVSLHQAATATSSSYPVRSRHVTTTRQSAPIRLTRRGYVALGLVVAAVTAGLLWLAHASAPAAPPTMDVRVVTVSEGDTLWSIASRIAPQRDPRTVVATLERINHLTSPLLQPGQVLRTR